MFEKQTGRQIKGRTTIKLNASIFTYEGYQWHVIICSLKSENQQSCGSLESIYPQRSMVSKSKMNCSLWHNFKVVRDFMPILVSSQFHKDFITIKCHNAEDKVKYGLFEHTMGQVTPRKLYNINEVLTHLRVYAYFTN